MRAGALVGAARFVGVLDAEEELAAVLARVEPVEERRARAADVQVAGGRRREAEARESGAWSCGQRGADASAKKKHEGPPTAASGPCRERRERDSNPRYEVDPLCRFSKPVPSASRPSLQGNTGVGACDAEPRATAAETQPSRRAGGQSIGCGGAGSVMSSWCPLMSSPSHTSASRFQSSRWPCSSIFAPEADLVERAVEVHVLLGALNEDQVAVRGPPTHS